MSKYGALTVNSLSNYPWIFFVHFDHFGLREMRKFRNESAGYGFQIRQCSTLHEAAWSQEVREKAAESLGMLVRRQRTTWSTCCMYISDVYQQCMFVFFVAGISQPLLRLCCIDTHIHSRWPVGRRWLTFNLVPFGTTAVLQFIRLHICWSPDISRL